MKVKKGLISLIIVRGKNPGGEGLDSLTVLPIFHGFLR